MRRAHLSRAPRHGLVQHRRHALLHPRESSATHASPGLLDEKICSDLKVPSSRQSMRKKKLPPAQSPARCPGELAKGRGFAQSGRSANRLSARARSALRARPGHSERKLTPRDPDGETRPILRRSLSGRRSGSLRVPPEDWRRARGIMAADSDDGVPSVPATSDGERLPRRWPQKPPESCGGISLGPVVLESGL